MTNKKPLIETFTEKEKLAAGRDQTIDVLVRITPPMHRELESKRPKLNIGIALDRSGSMGGQKMRQARDAATYCVDQLLPSDVFSAVIFDDQVDVLFTSQPVENKEILKRGIERIEARNSTALHEGWVKAGLQVSERLDPKAINRVLLITDGQANVGEVRIDPIVSQAKELSDKGVTTSTIGIGADFNEDLLMPMAEAGCGNSWHVQEPQDMVKIFETELRGLVTQIAHSTTLKISPADGVKVIEILNDFEDSRGRYKLPNLQAGTVLDLIVRLRVPAHVAGRVAHISDLELSYILQDSGEVERVTSSFEIGFETAEVVATLSENPEVLKGVQMLINARARREAMERMDEGDYSGARVSLKSVAASTDILFSRIASPDLLFELNQLNELDESLKDRDNDQLGRKLLAYQRESIRKGK